MNLILKITIWVLFILSGFFMGSIMFSKILPEKKLGIDICELSCDHNPGTANVFTNCGVKMGLICLFLDMFKGFLPVFLGTYFLNTKNVMFASIIVAPVLGHAVAPLNKYHGGKCIATSFGVLVGLLKETYIVFVLAVLYIIFSTFIKINPVRIRSIVTYGLFGIISSIVLTFNNQFPIALGCFLISLVAIGKHKKSEC